MKQPGKTNDIIAETWRRVEPLKITYTDKEPDIKLDAPVITEIGDLPANTYSVNIRTETAKWIPY